MFSSRADPERQSLLRRHAAPDANRTLKFIFGGVAATVILGAALAFLGTDGSFLRASELGASGAPGRLGTGTKPITYTPIRKTPNHRYLWTEYIRNDGSVLCIIQLPDQWRPS